MNIYTITITGADDKVAPEQLEKLSNKFPFVEWGILLSPNRAGQPRYPSKDWIKWLLNWSDGLRLSGHLCGKYTRDLLTDGKLTVANDHPELFGKLNRMQINFPHISEPHPDFFHALQLIYDKDVIFQLNSLKSILLFEEGRSNWNLFNAYPLHDRSGGKGMCEEDIEESARDRHISDCRMNGYAGGISPENIREHIETLERVFPEPTTKIWLDMENNVRTDNEFDLGKVEACLEIAEEYILPETRAATYFETNAGQKRVSQRPPEGPP